MPTLLPVFKGGPKVRKFNPANISGPIPPKTPSEELRKRIRSLEFPTADLPALKVVRNPDGMYRLDVKEQENILNYYAFLLARISTVSLEIREVDWDEWGTVVHDTRLVSVGNRALNPGFMDENQLDLEAQGLPPRRGGGQDEDEEDYEDDLPEDDERRPIFEALPGVPLPGVRPANTLDTRWYLNTPEPPPNEEEF